LRADYNIAFRWFDPGIALLGAIGGHALSGAIAIIINAVHHQSGNPDTAIYEIVSVPALGWIVLVLLTCFGAPVFEELFFRGLLQGQLIQRYGVGVGLVVTAVVFGACHIANAPGWLGVFYGLEIVGGGVALGLVRHFTGRLGASMTTHCFFNGIAVAALAITLH
jgi:membrane protease YdiL (CAAX protease family)